MYEVWRELHFYSAKQIFYKQLEGMSGSWVAWWLEHRTPDWKAWVRCPMPPHTLQIHTVYVLVKSVVPKVLWAESRVQGTGEYFSPLQTHSKIVEVEIGDVAIYRPFGTNYTSCQKVQNWFAEHQYDFQHIPLPPHNPYLNPIENAWD
ncbi:uncharacterized protein TNCV_5071741 [Trichonephila clavipes]|nr:uncharacterized protein TNCV_5071741 [Trichonephila clavipes]